MMRRRGKTSSEKGAALVETVVITPLLLFLILLTAEVTNAYVEHNMITKAARTAARHVAGNSLLGTTGIVVLTPGLLSETRNLAVFGNAAGTGSSILPGFSTSNVQVTGLANDWVQVSVTYPYTGLLGGSLPTFGYGSSKNLNVSLRATVTMRAL